MEKIARAFEYDYENDTTIEYFNTGLYAGLNCSFTSEDPAYGTDTLHYNSEPADTMEALAYEMLEEIRYYLDATNDGMNRVDVNVDPTARSAELELVYGEYSNSTLYAIEKALAEISKDYRPGPVINRSGHQIQVLTIEDVAKAIKNTVMETTNVKFNLGVGVEDHSVQYFIKEERDLYWYGVKLLPNDENLFDGCEFYRDYIFMVGYFGGGNVAMAYFCNEYMSLEEWDGEELVEAICKSLDMKRDEKILLETIKEEDK